MKERAQGHIVKQWQNQDPAELSSAAAVTPEQTSSSQQDNHYTILNIREFSSSFLTSGHWRFRIVRDKSLHFIRIAHITFHWEIHIEHDYHTQLRKIHIANAK